MTDSEMVALLRALIDEFSDSPALISAVRRCVMSGPPAAEDGFSCLEDLPSADCDGLRPVPTMWR